MSTSAPVFGPGTISPLDFDPPPAGQDYTQVFQQCIDFITGPSDPATTVRTCKAMLVLEPGGVYKISADLLPRSVIGFRLKGNGATIVASGPAFPEALLYVDGSLDAVVEDIVLVGDGTEVVPNAFLLDWSTAAARSTSANCFRDIRIRNLRYKSGFSLAGTGTRQLDGTDMYNIGVAGGRFSNWAADTTGIWGTGFNWGNGSWGNNYNHSGSNLQASGNNIGYKCNASSFSLRDAEPAHNGTDFWLLPGGQITLENVQSQQSGQFIQHSPSFSPAPVSVRDCQFVTGQATTPNWISIHGGQWHLDNLYAEIFDPTANGGAGDYVTPVVLCSGDGAGRPSRVTIDNYTAYGPMTSAVRPMNGNTRVAMRNYGNFYPKTGLYAPGQPGDMEAYWTGSTWNLEN